MTLTNLSTTLGLAVVLSVPATLMANPTTSDFDAHMLQVVTEAKKVQLEAEDLKQALKGKPDYSSVDGQMERLIQHIDTVNELVGQTDQYRNSLDSAAIENLDKMKTKAEVMKIFAHKKQDMLSSGEAKKFRSLFRAKAEGIALRAEMLQQSAMQIRQ
jgi:hypothetical protein